ncbi:MAG: hypothetical protein KJ645_13635 [Planctomycetes bacterium]|nr:hypothetical protein [Planctomycetota bacterium]
MIEALIRKKGFRAIVACGFVFALLILPAWAQTTQRLGTVETQVRGDSIDVRYTISFSEDSLIFGKLLGYDTVRFADDNPLIDPGKPLLPGRSVRIAIPDNMTVTGIHVDRFDSNDLPGKFSIFPAQPYWPASRPYLSDDFVEPDSKIYGSDQAYPAVKATFIHQTDLYGQNMAVVQLRPLSYVPAEKRLSLAATMEVVIEGVQGHECGDYLPACKSPMERTICEQTVREMVVNPDQVALTKLPGAPATLGVSAGNYDYTIIVPAGYTSYWQDFADWKSKKGYLATIVDLTWIYGQYSGSNQDKIRAFVMDARNTWGCEYFLIGGDTNLVPCHTKTLDGDNIPNDTYYGDYDDDYTTEVHVGRAPVRVVSDITNFKNKIYTYEKNPPTTNYAKTVFFMGFDLYTNGSGEGESCKTAINNLYLPSGWTYRSEFDSESGGHESDCKGYLNQGNNLVNHIDHSDTDIMGVGYTNHYTSLTTSEMQALTNGNRQSILYSIGCWACNFPDSTCIAEGFVKNTGGGGVAFVGNSRYGWYQPYAGDYASLRYDRYFFRSLFNQDHYRLGDCFTDHKNDGPTGDTTEKYIYTELTLLGDPEMAIWTENPTPLVVTHDTSLDVGVWKSFTVNVKSGLTNLADATVCVWKDGDVFQTGTTNSSGNVTLFFTPTTSGTLYVTVTARNKLPYEGQATVQGATVTYDLTVTSTLDGGSHSNAYFTCLPADTGGQSDGFTPKTLTFNSGTLVTLNAASYTGTYKPFMRWVIDGVGQPLGRRTVQVTVDHGMTAQINYTNYGLLANKYTCSVTGDQINFTLSAGPSFAGKKYVLLGSITGTEPGTVLPLGEILHLNWYPFTDMILAYVNTYLFWDFLGVLDGSAQATAQLNSGSISSENAGFVMYYAFCTYDPFYFTSNPIEIVFVN